MVVTPVESKLASPIMVLPRSPAPLSPRNYSKTSSWLLSLVFSMLAFLLGCLVGRLSMDSQHSISGLARSSPSTWIAGSPLVAAGRAENKTIGPSSGVFPDTEDAWSTIQVFVGKVQSVEPEDEEEGRGNPPHRWFSQASQDQLVLELLRYKRNGFFVDLAANDATLLSNTYALERFYGWQGLCIEPNPLYWYNLSHHRPRCRIVAAVVGARRLEPVWFRHEAGDHGGIAGNGFDNGPRWQRSSLPEYTVPLLEILQRNQAPVDIDYLSLDVEGAESFIMMQFPLDRYKIKIITAERLRGEIRSYLKGHGYEFVQRLSTWGESLWIHSSARDSLNMSALERFPFPNVAQV